MPKVQDGDDDDDDVDMGEHSTDGQFPISPFNPTADAIAEHQESEDLATVFRLRHKRRIASSQYQGDDRGDVAKFEDIFGNLSLIAIKGDDAPLWQVPVKVSLYDTLATIYFADVKI